MKYLISGVLFVAVAAGSATPAGALGKSDEAFARALACRDIAIDADRLACLDRALSVAEAQAENAPGKDETTETFGKVAEPREERKSKPYIAETPEDFGAEDVPALRVEQDSRRLKKIAFNAVKITTNSRNVTTIFLENGQVWRQLTSDDAAFYAKKDRKYAVEIKRGALGNYLASIDGFSKPLRVERIK